MALDVPSLAAWIATAAGLGTAAYGLVDVFAKRSRYRKIAASRSAETKSPDLPGFSEISALVKESSRAKRLNEMLGDDAIGILARVFVEDPDGPNLRKILIAAVRDPAIDPASADADWSELTVDAALATAKAQRIAANRVAATWFAVALGSLGAIASLVIACANGNLLQGLQPAALWLFMGIVGVPIAPIAKDISTLLAKVAARKTI